jgi:hypothetical protein
MSKKKHKKHEIQIGKEVAYYAGLLNASLQIGTDRDKLLITLSSGAIGLLFYNMNLAKYEGLPKSFFFGAIACFVLTIIILLISLHFDKIYLIDILSEEENKYKSKSRLLNIFEWITMSTFVVGIICSFICIYTITINEGESGMAKNSGKSSGHKTSTPKGIVNPNVKDSAAGIDRAKPTKGGKK